MNSAQPSAIDQPAQESPARCQHRTLKGRCRQTATDSAGTLCFHHARAQRQAKDDFTLLEPLVRKTEDLQSVEGIGEDLAALHNLLAEGRVSPRRASVIAYIDSLLLRTFVALDEKNKGNLNYYGQPIKTYDYSLPHEPDSASAGVRIPDAATEPATARSESISPSPTQTPRRIISPSAQLRGWE
jgi:hypothetical protein